MPGVMLLPSPHWVYLCPPKPITVEIPCLEITPCPPILESGGRDSWGQTPLHGTHYHEKGAVQAENPLLTPRTPPEHPGVMGRGRDQPKGAALKDLGLLLRPAAIVALWGPGDTGWSDDLWPYLFQCVWFFPQCSVRASNGENIFLPTWKKKNQGDSR